MESPTITIIAGPNGVGKTTFAQMIFSKEIEAGQFLNADQVAKELEESPGSNSLQGLAIQSGRKVIEQRRQFIATRKSFIVETTLASRSLAVALSTAKNNGFKIIFHYLWASTPNLCDFRVKDRVRKGGHNISIDVITRRYYLGLQYFNNYFKISDEAYIYLSDFFPNLFMSKTDSSIDIKDEIIFDNFCNELRSFVRNKLFSWITAP
ncbi:MAG: AAA family ATPase [Pseudanabaena sp.]